MNYNLETLYSTIPYTTMFYITRWTHGPQNLQRQMRTLIVLLDFWNKTNLRVICLFTARAVYSEWTHMWPATSVNNDDGTDYLRLSHLTALSVGVNNYLRCIHKGLTAFSRVTPPIRVHDQTILTRSFDPMDYHPDASGIWLPVVLNRWYDNTKRKSHELVVCNWRVTA